MPGLTVDNPVTLTQAIASATVLPGDVLSLADGTYTGDFTVTINGTEAAPIIIKARNPGMATIDGGVTINGTHIRFEGIEFLYSGWTSRISAQTGSAPTDIPMTKNLHAPGENVSFVDCVIHDLVTPYFSTVGGDIIGCHIYNNGWKGPDRGHGHGIYSQNGSAPNQPTKLYQHNVVHDNYGWGFHIWDEAAYLDEYTVEHNISFNAGRPGGNTNPNFIHKGGGPVNLHNYYRYNYTYRGRGNEFGQLSDGMDDGELVGNYFPDGIIKTAWGAGMVETGNTYGTHGNAVFVNVYKTTVAHVAVYNEASADSVTVDLTDMTGAGVGDTVNVHNAQDYANDVQVLTLDADKCIVVDMREVSHTVIAPIGGSAGTKTFPTFGAFIVEKA